MISFFPSSGAAVAVGLLLAGPASAMTLVIGTTDLEPGHVTAVTEADGRLVRSGTGFVAVGAFGDLDDATIRSAATAGGAMQDVLGQFQQLGAAHRFGLGPGLERIDGVFQAAVSYPTREGDGLVGRPIYVVGGTESGIFIFRSQLTFEADYPVAWGTVDMWGDTDGLAGGLLVGSMGESIEVLELGSSAASLKLSPVDGNSLDLARFENTILPAQVGVAVTPADPPAAAVVPPDPPDLGPDVSESIIPPFEDWSDPKPVVADPVGLPTADLRILRWPPGIDPSTMDPDPQSREISWSGQDDLFISHYLVHHTTMASSDSIRGGFADSGVAVALIPEPGCLALIAAAGLLVLRRARA